jgi:hypothetical protein
VKAFYSLHLGVLPPYAQPSCEGGQSDVKQRVPRYAAHKSCNLLLSWRWNKEEGTSGDLLQDMRQVDRAIFRAKGGAGPGDLKLDCEEREGRVYIAEECGEMWYAFLCGSRGTDDVVWSDGREAH